MEMFLGKNTKQYLSGLAIILFTLVGLVLIIKYVPLDPTKEEVLPVEEKLHYEDKSFNDEVINNNQNNIDLKDDVDENGPSFDIVNIDENGQAVIAGRAKPNSSVQIYNGDELIGEVQTNNYGEFVFIPDNVFESGNYELRLFSDQKESKESVSIYVAEKEVSNEAVVVLNDEEGNIQKVIQGVQENLETKDLTFDSLSYSDEGMLKLSGKARPGAKVEAYVDGKMVGEVTVGDDGFWNMVLDKPVNPGDYILRFHQIENESIISSIETPITQSDLSELDLGDRTYVVQPGNSLWRISRRYYGRGILYTIIFAKN
ncbi:MAG: hypothetical protein CMP44_01320, partial [Rickettsiales bacterium]|nr:hypothetical protein [Rickettsiales bacterium]